MPKEYTPKQFTPFIYPEWGELFDGCSSEKKAQYLMAIVKYPNINIENDPIWNFIKSQLDKDFDNFVNKCKKRGEAARNYWNNKGEQMISNDIKSKEMISSDNKGEPKPLTTNYLPLTKTLTETLTLRGEYKNVYLPEEKLRELEVYCMGKSIANDRIEYLSQRIALGKEDPYDSNFPERHFIRLKQLFDNYKKSGVVKQFPATSTKDEEPEWKKKGGLF